MSDLRKKSSFAAVPNMSDRSDKPEFVDASGSTAGPKSKSKNSRKFILGFLVILLVLFVGVIVVCATYFGSVRNSMGYEGDLDTLQEVLVEADYQEPFYVLVIGSDNWEDYGARSDAMVLTRIDLDVPQITLVSVPRDTPYEINGQTVKLNQVFAEQGEVACVEAVSELTGVDISHYVEVEFDQLEQVVDSLGGVKVDVPYSFDYEVYTKDQPIVHVDAGEQVLTGEQAVALARMRTSYEYAGVTQDAIRQANIRLIMIGMMKQVLSQPAAEIPGQVQAIASMVQTDIPFADLISWATSFAQADQIVLYSCTGPTEGDLDVDTGLWLTDEAPEQWVSLMNAVDSGSDPSLVMELKGSDDNKVQLSTSEVIGVS